MQPYVIPNLHLVLLYFAAMGGLLGLLTSIDRHRADKLNPPKSPAQRRAQREACRRKGR